MLVERLETSETRPGAMVELAERAAKVMLRERMRQEAHRNGGRRSGIDRWSRGARGCGPGGALVARFALRRKKGKKGVRSKVSQHFHLANLPIFIKLF